VSAPVLILTNERDFAADGVISRLHNRGVPTVRWNAETLPISSVFWSPVDPPQFRSVWLRDYLPGASAGLTVAELDEYLVVRAQWRDWLATLDSVSTRWVNPIWSSRRAENKAVQLTTAARIGLRVPATTITNDPDVARSFAAVHLHGAVVKTLAPGYFAYSDQAFMFTTELTDEVLSAKGAWLQQPLIVQRRIPRARDVRVIITGDHVAAAAVTTGGQDWRLSEHTLWTAITVSDVIADLCRELVRELGLVYAAIDLIDDGHDWWFLEANQAGEFQFLDRPLDLGVADAIATLLQ
jgi:glutathione synthase/RimK-type ligase-like ATP-grasp enzyme